MACGSPIAPAQHQRRRTSHTISISHETLRYAVSSLWGNSSSYGSKAISGARKVHTNECAEQPESVWCFLLATANAFGSYSSFDGKTCGLIVGGCAERFCITNWAVHIHYILIEMTQPNRKKRTYAELMRRIGQQKIEKMGLINFFRNNLFIFLEQ